MKHNFKKLLCTMLAFGMMLTIWPASVTEVRAAKKIPISSAQDFVNMESNPSGSYYLTKDITLPKEMKTLFFDVAFTGTLDGRGHKIKGFTYRGNGEEGTVCLFGQAKKASFQRLSLTGVDIRVDAGDAGARVGTLVRSAENCKFDRVNVSGKITVNGHCSKNAGASFDVTGLVRDSQNTAVFTDCSGSLKIKVNAGMANQMYISGLAGNAKSLKNCSFKGSITASAKASYEFAETDNGYLDESGDFLAVGLCETVWGKVTGCTNSGNIKLTVNKGSIDKARDAVIAAYGIAGGRPQTMTSCKNSGNIAVSAPKMKSAVKAYGLAELVYGDGGNNKTSIIKKCSNSGNISVTGGLSVSAAGLCENVLYASQCYNKGKVSAKGTKTAATCQVLVDEDDLEITGGSFAGGISVIVRQMNNCYNVGSVTLKGRGGAAGLACMVGVGSDKVSGCNYSIRTITAKNGDAAGLFYRVDTTAAVMYGKAIVRDSYYKGCKEGYCYGPSPTNKGVPRVTKISSVTGRSCPKLSSKYWTYSSKYKRLVLKNNKEK